MEYHDVVVAHPHAIFASELACRDCFQCCKPSGYCPFTFATSQSLRIWAIRTWPSAFGWAISAM